MTAAAPGAPAHRMADPATRGRVVVMLAALFGLALAVVAMLGRPTGPFTLQELRDVSGLPFAPPQIERRIAPSANDQSNLEQQIQQLEDMLRGSPAPQPAPSATR